MRAPWGCRCCDLAPEADHLDPPVVHDWIIGMSSCVSVTYNKQPLPVVM